MGPQVGVSIRMSSFTLTKMVTMSPFYTLVNKSSYELEVGELVGAATKWHYVPSAEVGAAFGQIAGVDRLCRL